MAKTITKAKKAAPKPATTPDKRTLKPHELVLSPTIQSAIAIEAWSKFAGTVDLAELVDDLRERVKKVQGGGHTRANTQCLCRRCNQAKSDTARGQLWLIP